MYEYRCIIDRVVDGDTVDVHIDLGFDVWLKNERIRVHGIDTPECRTRDLNEKAAGIAAKVYVAKLLPSGSVSILISNEFNKGKFGRILGDFKIEETTLTKLLIDNHYAVTYHGKSKDEIKEEHRINRQLLVDSGIIIV